MLSDACGERRQAALLLPGGRRWREPLLLTADQSYDEAAEAYERLASQPLAADTHLLAVRQASEQGRPANAVVHAEAVLAFAGQTGAVVYQRQAETLIAASA